MRVNAFSYGSGARPADMGSAAAGQLAHGDYRVMEYGPDEESEWVPEEIEVAPVVDPLFCGHLKHDGSQCKARPVRGAELCVGHSRSAAKAAAV